MNWSLFVLYVAVGIVVWGLLMFTWTVMVRIVVTHMREEVATILDGYLQKKKNWMEELGIRSSTTGRVV